MEDYIVRIQSAVEGKPVYFGTGIVISGHEVLTARHVVSGESHLLLTGDGSIPLSVQNETDSAVILHAGQQLPFRTAETFPFMRFWTRSPRGHPTAISPPNRPRIQLQDTEL